MHLHCQLFGERCTGTNYVSKLIERNTNIKFATDAGYKHSFPTVESIDRYVFVVTRNVYDWVRSLHRNPWGANDLFGLSMDEFLRTPWVVYYDSVATDDEALLGTEMKSERCPVTNEPFANVMKLRSAKYDHWLRFGHRSKRLIIAQYEYIDEWPIEFILSLSSLDGVELAEEYTPITHYKGAKRNGPFIRKVYEPLTSDQVDWINSQIDGKVEDALGYKLRGTDRSVEAVEATVQH